MTQLGLLDRSRATAMTSSGITTPTSAAASRCFGQLYATLARLDRDSKAIAGPAEPGGGPDRKRYVITDAAALPGLDPGS
jgi:hypothetical protein